MIILAIDQSSSVGSIAVLKNETPIAFQEWDEKGVRNQYMFSALTGLLGENSINLPDVDIFAVGLGPGMFSGLRISLSAMRGIALPAQKPVFGVGSTEAIARSVAADNGNSEIAVIGDARRGSFWVALFDFNSNSTCQLSLAKPSELASLIKADATVVSPDWDRIGETLVSVLPSTVQLIREKRVPDAKVIGEIAYGKTIRGEPSLPLMPIYLHPPVFVPPRFPAESASA